MPKLEDVYAQIDEQRGVLINLLNMARKNPIPPNRLSDVCMKLAILNELLGEHVVDLKARQLEREKEAYEEAKANKASDTGANAAARLNTISERQAFAKADTKHTDLWKLISMAQSHIRAEGDEKRGT